MAHMKQLPPGVRLCEACGNACAHAYTRCPTCGGALAAPDVPSAEPKRKGERLPPLPAAKLSTSAKAVARGRAIGENVVSMAHLMRESEG